MTLRDPGAAMSKGSGRVRQGTPPPAGRTTVRPGRDDRRCGAYEEPAMNRKRWAVVILAATGADGRGLRRRAIAATAREGPREGDL